MSTILSHWLPLAGAAVGAVLLLVLVARIARVARRASRARIVTVGLLVPAAMGLAMSASTSYRYAGSRLGITDVVERMTLCGVAEAGIIALTLHAWGTKSKGSALLAYFFVGAQAIPAFSVSGGEGGIVRIVLGPIMLALMLHKLLGIETKLSGGQSTGVLASFGREIRERLTARLGIGRRGADSAAIARSRAADRAVALASKRSLGKRTAARLSKAIDAAQHGLDPDDAAAAEASIVDRVVRRKSVAGLHGIDARHAWQRSQTVPAAAEEPGLQPVAPVIYPLPQRPLLPSFQTVPGSFTSQAIPSQTDEEKARALQAQGLSFQQIGTRLGRSKSWAHRACTAVPNANGSTP